MLVLFVCLVCHFGSSVFLVVVVFGFFGEITTIWV